MSSFSASRVNYGLKQTQSGFSLQPDRTLPPPDRLSFLSGPFEGRASIDGATVTLKRVTQEDAGEYRCEISAPLDSVSLGETNITLKVLGTAWENITFIM